MMKRIQQNNGKRESARRLAVIVVLVIYWLLIFEGALRKWGLPQLHKPLFFVRDPFVLFAYWLGLKHGLFPLRSRVFWVCVSLCVALCLLSVLQVVFVRAGVLTTLYGLRLYVFYLPLAFLTAKIFKRQDLDCLVRSTLLISIPIAVLTFIQWRSPVDSPLNRMHESDARIFIVAEETVRATGTFSFTAGQVLFVATLIPLVMSIWLCNSRDRPLGAWGMLFCSVAVISNFAVLGARAGLFHLAATLISCVVLAVVLKRPKSRLRVLRCLVVMLIFGPVLSSTIFFRAQDLMSRRMELAEASEGSVFDRALGVFGQPDALLRNVTLLGRGLGRNSGGGAALGAGTAPLAFIEAEWPRIVDEAGILGLCYIGFRVWLVVVLLGGAVYAARRRDDPLPLLLFSFSGLELLVGTLTMQGTSNGYGYLFLGFSLAANRISPEQSGEKNPTLSTRERLKQGQSRKSVS